MCLAIYKKRGVEIDEDFLRNAILSAYSFNKDGFGFAIKRSNNPNNELEFFRTVPLLGKEKLSINECIDKLFSKNIEKDDEVMIHLRMGTSGKIMDENTHPFICDSTTKTDNILEGKINYPLIIHNGVFSRTAYEVTNSDMCDTYHVAKQFFSVPIIPYLVMKKRKWIETLFNKFLSGKVCYMSNNSKIETILLGDWPCQEKGIIFSNSSYKFSETSFTKRYNFYDSNYKNDYYENNKHEEIFDESLTYRNKKESKSFDKINKREVIGLLGNFKNNNKKILCINSIKSFFSEFEKSFDENNKIRFDKKVNNNVFGHILRGIIISYHYINPGAILITNKLMKCVFKTGLSTLEEGDLPQNSLIVIKDLNSSDNEEETYSAIVVDLETFEIKHHILVSLENLLNSCDPLYYCSGNFNCLESTTGQISYSTIPSASLYYNFYVNKELENTYFLIQEKEEVVTKNNKSKKNYIKLENDEKILNYNNWSKTRYKKVKKALKSALFLKKNTIEIKIDNKKYGPYQTTFIEKLINQYEKKMFTKV